MLWAWPVAPPPHLTEDEHPPEPAASPVRRQLLLDLLCEQKGHGGGGHTRSLPGEGQRLPLQVNTHSALVSWLAC